MAVDLLSTWMSAGPIDWMGAGVELAVGVLYATAARRRWRRGARWPVSRTAAFLGGLLVIALALQSPLGAYDEVPWIHMLQHVLLMTLAPLLLVLGAPITLILRTLPPARRRGLVRFFHDPSVRGLVVRPWVALADYNVTMVILLTRPVYQLTEQRLSIHVAAHAYLIICGLLFWLPALARDPVPGRLNARQRRAVLAANLPLGLALATVVLIDPSALAPLSPDQNILAASTIAAGTALTSALGLALVASPRTSAAPARRCDTQLARPLPETSAARP